MHSLTCTVNARTDVRSVLLAHGDQHGISPSLNYDHGIDDYGEGEYRKLKGLHVRRVACVRTNAFDVKGGTFHATWLNAAT